MSGHFEIVDDKIIACPPGQRMVFAGDGFIFQSLARHLRPCCAVDVVFGLEVLGKTREFEKRQHDHFPVGS